MPSRSSSSPSATDGPRERLDALGPAALSDAELLALLLRTGGPGRAALGLATDLLARHDVVAGLARTGPAELRQTPGVGPAKSASLLAALELGRRLATRRLRTGDAIRGPADGHKHFHARLRDAPRHLAHRPMVLVSVLAPQVGGAPRGPHRPHPICSLTSESK